MSDLYNPSKTLFPYMVIFTGLMIATEYVFLSGAALLSVFSLGTGFARDEVTLFILRAFTGIGRSPLINGWNVCLIIQQELP
jgi:hypothetical protein